MAPLLLVRGRVRGPRSAVAKGTTRRVAQGPVRGQSIALALLYALYAPAGIVLLLYLWGFLEHAWAIVRFPYQIDYGEMPELNRAWLLARGQPIYVDWSAPPYQMANYTPLYSLVAAAGVAWQGTQFGTGRLLSLTSTLATALAIGVTASSLTGARRAGLLAGLIAGPLYVVAHPVWNWGALQRVDAFAVALEWLGIALYVVGWLQRGRRAALWSTVPLFLSAVYARQTVVAGALAAFGVLLYRRPRLGLALLAVYAGAGLALLGILQGLTAGQFWRHTVDGNLNHWSWARVDYFGQPLWQALHWSVPLATFAVLARVLRRQNQLPALYLLGAGATALTVGKIGSNVNYFLQLWAALALLVGLAVGHLAKPATRPLGAATELGGGLHRQAAQRPPLQELALRRLPSVLRWGSRAAVALWLVVGLQQAYHVPHYLVPHRLDPDHLDAHLAGDGAEPWGGASRVLGALQWAHLPLWRLDPFGADVDTLAERALSQYAPLPGPADGEHARAAERYVRAVRGDVLGEEMSFSVTTGKRLYLQPFEFSQLAAQGDWDQGPLLEDVRRGHFAAVVLRFRLGDDPLWRRERVNDALIDSLIEAYRLDAVFGDYYLYRPATTGD